MKAAIRAPRVFDTRFKVGLDKLPPPSIVDWPPELQDAIYEAMERMYEASGLKNQVNITRCTFAPTPIVGVFECYLQITEILTDADVRVTH